MIILGVSVGENSSAALMVDGELVGASYEERFHRIKCYAGFPYRTIEHLLDDHGISPEQIDKVAVRNEMPCNCDVALVQRTSAFGVDDYIREAHEYYKPILLEGKSPRFLDVFHEQIQHDMYPPDIVKRLIEEGETVENSHEIRSELVRRALDRDDVPVEFVEHHLSHAVYGYIAAPSNVGKALVFTADSFGDYSNANVYRISNERIENIHCSAQQNLGQLFRNVTLLLGMKPYQHEYKVMGLAPYASPLQAEACRNIFASYMKGFDGEWKFDDRPRDHYFTFREALEGFRFDSIAGGLQLYFEEMLLQWFEYYIKENADFDTVIFSGGLCMNVKANMHLDHLARRHGMRFFAAPSADDYSHCIGSAYGVLLNANHELTPEVRPGVISTLGLGYEFSQHDEQKACDWARSKGWQVEPLDLSKVAHALASSQIFALCQGRAEFGARSLGFRSIVADPRDFDTVRRINMAIKQRDFWMPFAPAILEGYEGQYLDIDDVDSHRFMACAAQTTEAGKRLLKSAMHPYDETARPQIVSREINAQFYDLIEAFGMASGAYALLNTSLNLHGYPIVNDADDLIFVLENSDLDGCILDGHFITRQ
jgi:carbamoyltransferase